MKLKKYPCYKSSIIPWINKVPSHWRCIRAKWLFKKMEHPVKDSDEVITCFRDGVVTLRKNRRTLGFTESLKEIGYQGIQKGELVIHQMDAFAGAVGVSDSNGKGSPVYSVCTTKEELNTYFFAKLIREMARSKFILSLAKGIRERSTDFRFEIFSRQILPVPPLDEQKIIASFIRAKERKIAKFIRNKLRLIKLLKEQKQAIINQAVTRGIDPDVRFKPSEVEWLGDIPEHWKVKRLRYIANVKPSGVDKNTNEGEIPVKLCNYVDVYKNEKISKLINFMNATATSDEIVKYELKSGDVLITKDSEDWNDIAVPAFVSQKMPGVICAYHLAIVRPIDIEGEFLYKTFLAESIVNQFRVSANGVTRYGLSRGAIKDGWFPIPPQKEQYKIIEYINQKLFKIHFAIEKAKREIELIQEYRTCLISDVVTGKLGVRNINIDNVLDEEIIDGSTINEETQNLNNSIKEVSNEY